MISLVVYGRNDSYGYNLHKRAALSLNCMAEMLADDDDEIIFVDYNSPNDHPTFPEAIRDTLTQKVCRKLRILRVRPRVHERYRHSTPLPVLEAVARNVGIRRSRSTNRWVLSTNTDMIFVSLSGRSLSEIARDLPRGLYHAPRIEVPETLWESLDRTDPRAAIEAMESWGRDLHLNEIVRTDKVLYDGPGDFQLIDRHDLHANQGFHEGMLLGWHLDSNLAVRTKLLYGAISDLGSEVFGYHCDHTRQLTLSHGPARLENSWARFIDGVERPDIPEQAETWGCAGEEIEEVTLDLGRRYVDVLRECVGSPQEKPLLADYKRETYDQTDYDPRHVLPFLVDLFLSAERSTKLAWIGARPETLALFAAAWRKLEFTSPILLTRSLAPTEVPASEFSYVSPETLGDVPNAFVFDFGLPNRGLLAPDQRRCIGREFLRIVRTEHDRLASGANARRIVCINTANSSLDPHVVQHIAAGLTPFSTRLRHGLVLAAPPAEQEWISRAQTGPAGKRDSATIRSGETDGLVCYGPRRHLFAGSYAFHVEIGWSGEITGGPERVGIIELLDRGTYVAHRAITRADLENGQVSFAFEVDEEASDDWDAYIEPRVRTFVPAPLVINAIWSELRTRTLDPPQPSLASGVDWLDALIIGPAGRWLSSGHIEIDSANEGGVIAYGPYWALPPGRYELHLISETSSEAGGMLVAEVVSGDRFRGGAVLPPNDKGRSACIVFEVHREEGPESLLIEVRLRATGALSGSVSLAMIRRIGEGLRQSPWTSPPSLGDDYERCA